MPDVLDTMAEEGGAAAPARRPIPGQQAAAILMLLFSEEQAAEILARLEPEEVRQLSEMMYTVADIGAEDINEVLDMFIDKARNRTMLGYKAEEQIEGMLKRALGDLDVPDADHVLARVHAAHVHAWVLRGDHDGEVACARSHIEDRVTVAQLQRFDCAPAPVLILSHGHDAVEQIIATGDLVEHLAVATVEFLDRAGWRLFILRGHWLSFWWRK